MKSLTFKEKLNRRLQPDPILEQVDIMLDLHPARRFKTKEELKHHLAEGALLCINKLSSHALSVPCGDYMVWMTDPGHTMLVPITERQSQQEIFTDANEQFEIFTPDLLDNWSTVERTLNEEGPPGANGPDTGGNGEADAGETDDGAPEPESGEEFSTSIDMSSVDRTPIVRAMQQHGFTVTSLANAVGVDPPAISRILRSPRETSSGDPGGRNPSLPLAARIANVLRMDAEALFPDIFGTPKQQFQARQQPANRGSGMSGAAAGSTKKGKASKMWTQGNAP